MKAFLATFFIILSCFSFGQPGTFWLQKAGSSSYDEGADISSDAYGNTYTTGYFSGTVSFGSIQLTSSGAMDIFLAKTDLQGNFMWAVSAGGFGPDKGCAVKTDPQGNSYVTGFYYGTASFGTASITSVNSSQDAFLAKYNNAGTLQWVISAGGNGGDMGNGVNIDNSGNVIITGQFLGTAVFGSATLVSTTDPGTGLPSIDVFTAKYSASNGNFIWAEQGAAHYNDRGLDVACDPAGNVYVIGQFSDTITFDQTHNLNMNNACFIIKYDAGGNEQWFRCIGGTSQCLGYGIATDQSSNVYVTGDFNSSLIFFGSPNTTISNTYPNCVFIAKYDLAGSLLWAKSIGSESELTSRNIAVDDSSNAYVTGHFKCRLNDFSENYGQGTFNSVGHWDIFSAKYNAMGTLKWAQQAGGRQNDCSYGICTEVNRNVTIAGSFEDDIVFPGTNDFIWPSNNYSKYSFPCNNNFCSDPYYGTFYIMPSVAFTDIFICKSFDPDRHPYDYYVRGNNPCQTPFVGCCIDDAYSYCNTDCLDSIEFCNSGFVYALTNTLSPVNPDYLYSWSNGQTGMGASVNSHADYSVTVTTADGCFTSSDTIHVNIDPLPPRPTITDNHGINVNSMNPLPISICLPDSVIITAGNICSGCTFTWSGSGAYDLLSPLQIMPTTSGTYTVSVTDSNGCKSNTSVNVTIDSVLFMPNITSGLVGPDTVEICQGQAVTIQVVDVFYNNPYPLSAYQHSTIVTITPSAPWSASGDQISIYPSQTGLYHITTIHTIILENNCSSDSVKLFDTIDIYVIINPNPVLTISINGDLNICEGDTTIVYVTTNGDNVQWSGGGILGSTVLDSVVIIQPGYYSVTAWITDTNGCSAYNSIGFSIQVPQPPTVTMNPSSGIICPGGNVTLYCTGTGTFQWYGPSGTIGGNSSSVSVSIPGFYFCILTNTNGCVLSSNSVEVKQYSTPYLSLEPGPAICAGDSVIIHVVTDAGSLIQWQPPLSGSGLTQVIYNPGTYTCNITSCGITTPAEVTITVSDVSADITASGSLNFCPGDTVFLCGIAGMSNYIWLPDNQSTDCIAVTQSGEFTLIVTDQYSCSDTSLPVTTSVYSLPSPTVDDTIVCFGGSLVLSAASPYTVTWYDQEFNGNLLGTSWMFMTPQIYDTTTYYVVATDSVCPSFPASLNVFIYPGSDPPDLFSNSPVCEGDTIRLHADSVAGGFYQWSGPAGFSSASLNWYILNAAFENTGYYSLFTSTADCNGVYDSVYAEVLDVPVSPLPDTTISFCAGLSITLDATYPGASYLWNDGSVLPVHTISDSSLCWVIIELGHCKVTDTIDVYLEDCAPLVEMPNVFTPDQDGYNDLFLPKTFINIESHKLKIFNRWGRLVYDSEDALAGWDGKDQGNECSDGVYFWILEYVDILGHPGELCGTVTLIQ